MAAAQAFPQVDTAALDNAASSLKLISGGMSDVGTSVSGLRGAVDGSEQWRGQAAGRWSATVGDRVSDASLTAEVMGKAASLMDQLAAGVSAERRAYNQAAAQMSDAGAAFNPRFSPAPPGWDTPYLAAMNAAAKRAADLLVQAGSDFLALAALAGDIDATTAANRMPGVPAGTNHHAASLTLLATLFGSVTGNQAAGSQFEQAVLNALGIGKNTTTWRPGAPFEGKITAGGLARGTIADGEGSNYLVEIKGTSSLQLRYQLRLQVEQAQQTGNPLWILKASGQDADPSVLRAAEGTGGGVLYTSDNGKSFTDGSGNPVQLTYDKGADKLDVSGYQPSGGNPAGGQGAPLSPDPGAPSAPVDPAAPEVPAPAPEVPEVPEVPEFPEIIP